MKKIGSEERGEKSDVERQLARIVPLWGAIVRSQQQTGVMEPVALLSWCVRLYQAGYEDGGAASHGSHVSPRAQGLDPGTTATEADWTGDEGRRMGEWTGEEEL